jgi:hypothetical protein
MKRSIFSEIEQIENDLEKHKKDREEKYQSYSKVMKQYNSSSLKNFTLVNLKEEEDEEIRQLTEELEELEDMMQTYKVLENDVKIKVLKRPEPIKVLNTYEKRIQRFGLGDYSNTTEKNKKEKEEIKLITVEKNELFEIFNETKDEKSTEAKQLDRFDEELSNASLVFYYEKSKKVLEKIVVWITTNNLDDTNKEVKEKLIQFNWRVSHLRIMSQIVKQLKMIFDQEISLKALETLKIKFDKLDEKVYNLGEKNLDKGNKTTEFQSRMYIHQIFKILKTIKIAKDALKKGELPLAENYIKCGRVLIETQGIYIETEWKKAIEKNLIILSNKYYDEWLATELSNLLEKHKENLKKHDAFMITVSDMVKYLKGTHKDDDILNEIQKFSETVDTKLTNNTSFRVLSMFKTNLVYVSINEIKESLSKYQKLRCPENNSETVVSVVNIGG